MTIGSFNNIGSRQVGNQEAAAEVPMFETFATMAKAHEPSNGLDIGMDLTKGSNPALEM